MTHTQLNIIGSPYYFVQYCIPTDSSYDAALAGNSGWTSQISRYPTGHSSATCSGRILYITISRTTCRPQRASSVRSLLFLPSQQIALNILPTHSLLIIGLFLLFVGYTGIKHYFDAAAPLSTLQLCILVMFSFFTGAGGSAGVTAAVNATAKSFPDLMVRLVLAQYTRRGGTVTDKQAVLAGHHDRSGSCGFWPVRILLLLHRACALPRQCIQLLVAPLLRHVSPAHPRPIHSPCSPARGNDSI